jgi:CheY-like chemotaxis protein
MHVVVVAEDDLLILMAITDYLTEEGFQVLEVRHADEALAILALDPAIVHVLFTDIHMPGEMNGIALSNHVKTHWPWIGILVTSAHGSPSANNLPEGSRFLRKPYHPTHVVERLRELAKAA